MSWNSWDDCLTDALQGDQSAIAAVAQRLKEGPREEERRDRDEFTDAVDGWRSENRDLLTPDLYQKVVDEDARLSKHPDYRHLDYRTRLNLAGNAVRRGQGLAENDHDADAAINIQRLRESRRQGVKGNGAFLDDDDSQAIAHMGRRAPETGLEERD